MGFTTYPNVEGIYRKVWVDDQNNKKILLVLLYVDDIITAYNDYALYSDFALQLKQKYKIKELYAINQFLNIHIHPQQRILKDGTKKTGYLFLQKQYILKMLKRFNMFDGTQHWIPLPAGTIVDKFSTDISLQYVDKVPKNDFLLFQQMIGSLMYLVNTTRFDIAHPVNKLAQQMHNLQKWHLKAAKSIMRYLKFILHHVFVISPADQQLRIYCDADWTNNRDNWKSASGVVVTFGHAPIYWISRKQRLVTNSTIMQHWKFEQ